MKQRYSFISSLVVYVIVGFNWKWVKQWGIFFGDITWKCSNRCRGLLGDSSSFNVIIFSFAPFCLLQMTLQVMIQHLSLPSLVLVLLSRCCCYTSLGRNSYIFVRFFTVKRSNFEWYRDPHLNLSRSFSLPCFHDNFHHTFPLHPLHHFLYFFPLYPTFSKRFVHH